VRPAVRGALAVVCALCLAGVGAVGAVVVHWYVIQPSDDEVRAVAAGVSLDGFDDVDRSRVVSGAWAPSFERGGVHWDATSHRAVTRADLTADLRRQGWSVQWPSEAEDGARLRGERGAYYVTVSLLPGSAGTTRASVSVGRGDVTPSLRLTIWAGVAAGALLGAALGLVLRRPARTTGARGGPPTWSAPRRGVGSRRGR
jgi:hypothetical protein